MCRHTVGCFLAAVLVTTACAGSGDRPTTAPEETTAAATTALTSTTGAISGTTSTQPPVATSTRPPRPAHGFSFSPQTTDPESFVPFFAAAAQGSTTITWAGDWLELAEADSAAVIIAAAAARQGMETMVVVGPFSEGLAIRPLDTATSEVYRDAAVDFVAEHRPRFIVLGVEVDVAAEKDPAAFAAFVPLFAETTRRIHQVAPATRVLVAFQLERLSGRKDGLFGGEQTEPRWDLIELFPDADIIAFTTYPGLIYRDPSDLPADYYSRLAGIAGKPVAFIEAGWFSESIAGGWESDAAEQARFVDIFLAEAAALSAEPVVWSFLYDQPVMVPFASMGLLGEGDTTSPGWEAWLDFWSGDTP